MNTFFKFFGWLFVLLFLWSALLQYNDSDPILWIVVYGVAALVTLGFLFDKIKFIVPLIASIFGFLGFLYHFPIKFEGFTIGQGDIKNIEEGREAFGLLIIAIVMLVISIRIRVRNRLKV